MWKAQNCNCLAYFCDLKKKHRRLTLFLFSKFIHPVSFVIFFYHCTSSFGLSPQATMTKKDQKLFYCGLQQIMQCSCCFWRPLWTKFMRKYQEYLIPSVTDTKTRICWVNLAVGPQQPLSSKQVWIHDIFTFSPKVMGLYNKEDYFDLLWFSPEIDTFLQLCTNNNAELLLLFCVCFSKLSSGLQGPILKRGILTGKVIREAHQVIVKKPLGDCQGPLVRRPEIVSTVSPLGAIRELTTMLQRRSRLSRVESSRARSAVSHRVHSSCAWQWGSQLPYK